MKKKKVQFTVTLEPVDAAALSASNLLQSGFWAAFKESYGWKPLSFMVHCAFDGREMDVPLFILCRPLPAGYHLAYIPHGPSPWNPLPAKPCECLLVLVKSLRRLLPRKTLFIRFDAPWGTWGEFEFPEAFCKPFQKAA